MCSNTTHHAPFRQTRRSQGRFSPACAHDLRKSGLLRELGLTYPQYLTLVALWQHGPATVNDIAQHLDLPANALTPLLQRLETAGLVVRRRSPQDGRALLVELTSAGVELEPSAAAVQRTVGHATGLSPHTLGALRDELHDLTDVLRPS